MIISLVKDIIIKENSKYSLINRIKLLKKKINENKKAYSDFIKAIELNPNKGLYYVGRAIIYKDNEIKKAEEDIVKALELSDDLETYKKIGTYYTFNNK